MFKRNPGQWAMKYSKCVTCGKTERPHFSSGKCQPCYFADYNPRNRAKIQRYKRNWYVRNGGKAWAKIQREQRNYGGLREQILKRDNYTCQRCGSKRQLIVHHRDRRGRPVPPIQKNNSPKNLETVCRACHLKEHRPELWAVRAKNNFRRPSGLRYKTRKAG